MGDRKLERELLGYLVGALDEREQDRVRRRLARSPALSAALTRLEEDLEPLRLVARTHQPPPGLAARTCQRVFALTQAMAARRTEQAASRRSGRERARAMSPVAAPPVATAAWGWSDVVVAVGVFLAIAGLLFPAIHHSRVNMRLMACQNNLRQFGVMHAHLDDAFAGAGVHPAVINPWITAEMPLQSNARPTGLALVRSADPPSRATVWERWPDPNDPRPNAQPFSNWSTIECPADAACSISHPGVRQLVFGRNLLLPDGQVRFMVLGPVADPLAATSAPPAPLAATFVSGSLKPNDAQTGLAPIVLLSQ